MKARNVLLALMAAVVLTGSLWAQHNHHQPATQPPTDSQSAPSGDMMTACHHHMSEAKETLAKLDAAVTEAQQAETPTKEQAALSQVRSLTDELKKHIGMCPMTQSESMQNVDGMSCMDGRNQKDQGKQQ
jgi:hypothetical protein